MSDTISPISRAVSDVLTGAYARKRLTQEQIAAATDMPLVTVQKKLRGRAPISATDLVVLSRAIGVDPAKMLEEALADLAEAEVIKDTEREESLMSEGVVSLSEHRRKKPSEMTDEELEGERSAANTDPEIGHDEPDAP